jgi:hypothetical protein
MKNLNKLLYVLFMSFSFLAFVACSEDDGGGPAVTPIDTGGGILCSACPSGYSTDLAASAIGKAYSGQTERLQIALDFFGAANTTWSAYPMSSSIAAQGIFYPNIPIQCNDGSILPQQVYALQTSQVGVLTSYHTIQNLVLTSGSLQIIMPNVAINQMPMGAGVVDVSGRHHNLSISTLSQPIYIYNGNVSCGFYGIRGAL